MPGQYHPLTTNGKFNGTVTIHTEHLDIPLKRKKPTVWAIWNDLFHEDVPDDFISDVLNHIYCLPRHIYLLLTKRIERMRDFFLGTSGAGANFEWPNHIWFGITVCNQQEADEKIPLLLQIPAAVRWISIEPMLAPIDISPWLTGWTGKNNTLPSPLSDALKVLPDIPKIDWVVLGGETGPGARPMKLEWVRDVRDQCQAAGIRFFFKAWGPRKEVGRILDGWEWSELPKG
jgi:protein gp37